MNYAIIILSLIIFGLIIERIVNTNKKHNTGEKSETPKNLKQEIKFVADTTGYENLQNKIDNTYKNVIVRIKDRAQNGYYRYSYDDFANTHENQMILDGVCKRLCADGFSAEHHNYGFSWREIVVTWSK
jgi:hypothetical protein